jgi:molybdopterin/thiamine biosynthesis adenylyltransferase
MKSEWNVDTTKSITIARLIGELEGVSYILDCLDEPEEFEYISKMKQKYYKKYFQMLKSEQ